MKITYELLCAHGAADCPDARLFREIWPDGAEPTVEVLDRAAAEGLDWLWCVKLLPLEGIGGQRDFSVRCVDPVAHLLTDERSVRALDLAGRRVADPTSVSGGELAAAWDAAWDAAGADQRSILSAMLMVAR